MQLKEASILVVDDEPVLLDIMGEWFQGKSGKVLCAADGAQALEILAAHKIDLIISDVRMPVMDGISLLKKIKANGLHTPKVILITGFADIQRRDAYDLGAEALLEKPTQYDKLLSIVQTSLLEPDERWQKLFDLSAYPVLRRSFASLAGALREHRIAFGWGGFCMEAGGFQVEGPVNIELTFKTDGYVLSGQGVVRWLAHQLDELGIELTYVAAAARSRVTELGLRASSFIPRTTGREYHAAA